MRKLSIPLIFCIPAACGCVTPPEPQPRVSSTAHHIQLTSTGYETEVSVTLPEEPYLEGPYDVDFFVQFALERNPEILAAQNAVAAQVQRIPQVTALDDPMLTDTFQPIPDNSVQTAAGRAPNTLALSQKLPWLGKLRVRGEVAEQESKIALTRLAQAELKVIEDVKLSYYELAYNQNAITIVESDKNLLEQLLQFAEARYRTGATSQQDVLRAQVELDRLADRLIELKRQQRSAQADLAKVIHTSPEAMLQANTDIDVPIVPAQIDALYEAAVRCRPELQERLHAIIRDERKRDLAHMNYYPDFNLGVGWQTVTERNALSMIATGNDNVSFMVGVSLPIWRDKLDAGVREAEQRSLESARRYDASRDDTLRMIRRYIVQAEALEEQIILYKESIIPKSEQALRISTADYRVNKVDFQQILDNWSDLLMFQLQVVRMEASLNQTLASLERVIGCQLATLPETNVVEPARLDPIDLDNLPEIDLPANNDN
ncbi:TolC family protein [Thalassoglobus polymorphus]|uniref:Cobalt-zinc-cadmium resistance protein CzcC n=1 Tax=Thalassoglobus polymorphus TaxID=2527994 RepID=A0A517QKR2_9PLAN|nr:TolC family protein [Thalassoglobus polymorphus]QDT32235.1 Cobalt-zinc-cadmium resistance protein CzcC precursor [Thalassoglobus polymorphus]